MVFFFIVLIQQSEYITKELLQIVINYALMCCHTDPTINPQVAAIWLHLDIRPLLLTLGKWSVLHHQFETSIPDGRQNNLKTGNQSERINGHNSESP